MLAGVLGDTWCRASDALLPARSISARSSPLVCPSGPFVVSPAVMNCVRRVHVRSRSRRRLWPFIGCFSFLGGLVTTPPGRPRRTAPLLMMAVMDKVGTTHAAYALTDVPRSLNVLPAADHQLP